MLAYIFRRLLLMIPTVIGITLVVFFVMALAPGGVAAHLEQEGQGMRPEEQRALREYYNQRYGLDDPLYLQYLRWLNNVLPIGFYTIQQDDAASPNSAPDADTNAGTGDADANADASADDAGPSTGFGFKWPDLGRSFTRNQPVTQVVAEALPITVLLNAIAIPITYIIAIIAGVYAARYRGQLFDVSTGVVFLALWSLPVMWIGVMLIGFFASDRYLQWFPTGGLLSPTAEQMTFLPSYTTIQTPQGAQQVWSQGYLLDLLWHLVLPVLCLVYGSFAFLSKLMRAAMLENMAADFVRTARAKGVREQTILFHHVLRNSLLPLITMAASLLPALLGGSLIVERIFSINGMGTLMIDAINTRDREIVLSVTLVISLISLLSLIVRDVLYALADPRVSYE